MKKLFCEDDKIAYYASDDGKIWSLRKRDGLWLQLKPWMANNGYLLFKSRSHQNGARKNILVHRAVWQAFNGPIPQGLEINHKNCIRTDNSLNNLELVTPSQNNLHSPTREHQREAHRHKMRPVCDLSTDVVYESVHEAARQTGLDPGNISNCCNGRYSHTGGHIFKFAS